MNLSCLKTESEHSIYHDKNLQVQSKFLSASSIALNDVSLIFVCFRAKRNEEEDPSTNKTRHLFFALKLSEFASVYVCHHRTLVL